MMFTVQRKLFPYLNRLLQQQLFHQEQKDHCALTFLPKQITHSHDWERKLFIAETLFATPKKIFFTNSKLIKKYKALGTTVYPYWCAILLKWNDSYHFLIFYYKTYIQKSVWNIMNHLIKGIKWTSMKLPKSQKSSCACSNHNPIPPLCKDHYYPGIGGIHFFPS